MRQQPPTLDARTTLKMLRYRRWQAGLYEQTASAATVERHEASPRAAL